MQHRRLHAALIILGAGMAIASGIALLSVQAARAQCGSQASSCKNCHETQAKDPVNNDGTGWHVSHAFGDFCYICHGGNSQSMDETAAHTGMTDPMSDIQAACAQCHPSDLQARADVYAAKLGRPASLGAATQNAASPTPAAASAAAAPTQMAAGPVPQAAPAPNSPDLVDYVQRYNQQVLNQQPTNWGNLILMGIIAVFLVGGLLLVNSREGWIRVALTEKKPLDQGFSPDVVSIATQVSKLKPSARK